MPLYDYRCGSCGRTDTAWRRIDDRHDGPECCAEPMRQMITAPMVIADIPGYTSPIDGRWVEGRRARKEDLRRNGCREYDPTERTQLTARKQREETEFERKVSESVEAAIHQMPTRKREKLIAEVEHGASAEIIRK